MLQTHTACSQGSTEPWHKYKNQFSKDISYTILSILLSESTEAQYGQTAVGAESPPPPQHFPASLSSPGFPATRSFSEVKIPLQYASG